MSVTLINSRSQIALNAKAYEALVTEEVYRLPRDLKKTALETITRTQAWITVQDTDISGENAWLPVPQKWGGVVGVNIGLYEECRRGGIDLQRIEQTIKRIGCYEAPRNHPAWLVLRNYASNLGLVLRSGTTLWVINGEDLAYVERVTLDIVTDLATARNLSLEAREVLSQRLVA